MQRMGSPYDNLPEQAFWRTGVAERDPRRQGDLYQPRFPLARGDTVITAGSCFAQHIGRALRKSGVRVLDGEPLPNWVPDAVAAHFGYRLYSGRYGNIYTARHLRQLLDEASGAFSPAHPVWEKDGRFYDAMRPGVEPDGLPDRDTVLQHRERHLNTLHDTFAQADVMVFTFGLTECWEDRKSGTVYPVAPGVIAGSYDPDAYAFRNLTFDEIYQDFSQARARLLEWNPSMRFLVTVSPVPLTATASGQHVELASSYSKSVLRAVCGALVTEHSNVDYVPSFELITSQKAAGAYFSENLRTVTPQGVAAAMEMFLSAHGLRAAQADNDLLPADHENFEICEEALMEAFAP